MRVEFSAQILSDENFWSKLDRIVYFFEEGRHLWFSDDPETVEKSPWFLSEKKSRGKDTRRKLFEESIKRESYLRAEHTSDGPHAICIAVCQTSEDDYSLAPDDAYSTLNRAGYILVEDAESDSVFVESIVQAFDNVVLFEALERKWISFKHMGGCGQLERTIGRLRKESPGPMRAVVLTDSDRQFPGEETKNETTVRELCGQYDLEGFVLKKREAENYLTMPLLNNSGVAPEVLGAFKRLSQPQKDFFDMKHGFPANGVPNSQSLLYANVSRPDIERLKNGFGKKCWKLFERHASLLDEDGLKRICEDDPEELPRILKALEKLI